MEASERRPAPHGGTGVAKPVAKKVQRIRMRMIGNPVKHDGELVEWAPDGSSFKVRFDGPLPDTTFYTFGTNNSVVDKVVLPGLAPCNVPGCNLWEVL